MFSLHIVKRHSAEQSPEPEVKVIDVLCEATLEDARLTPNQVQGDQVKVSKLVSSA